MAYKGESQKSQRSAGRMTFKNSNIYDNSEPTPREVIENLITKAKSLSKKIKGMPKNSERKKLGEEYYQVNEQIRERRSEAIHFNKTRADWFVDTVKERLTEKEFEEIMLEAQKRWALCK